MSHNQSPTVTWCKERDGFALVLPKGHLPSPFEIEPLFKGQLLDCFKEPTQASPHVQRPAPPEDWADVSVDNSTGKPAIADRPMPQLTSTSTTREINVLPRCDTLARPDELYLKPPYHLTVVNAGNTFVEVQCSHSPTLQLLADYLKKWCRTNHQDSQNVSSAKFLVLTISLQLLKKTDKGFIPTVSMC